MASNERSYGTLGSPPSTPSVSTAFLSQSASTSTASAHPLGWMESFSKLRERASLGATTRTRGKSVEPAPIWTKDNAPCPVLVFKSLVDVLLQDRVPGPQLLRLREEFEKIGEGQSFRVLALSSKCQQQADAVINNQEIGESSLKEQLRKLKVIAVKSAFVSNDSRTTSQSSVSLSEHNVAHTFGKRLSYVYDEINALCQAPFRRHRNIVKLVGWGLCLDTLEDASGEGPRIPLLLLERAESSLGELLRSNPGIPYETLRDLCHDVGRGLQAIHREAWIHGDLKFDNILIYREDQRLVPKVCDFGLSHNLNAEERPYLGSYGWAPLKGSLRLTPGFLQQCDIFAYGLIVWSIFTRTRSPDRLPGTPLPSRLWTADNEHLLGHDRDYSEQQIYYTASQAVRESSVVPAEDLNRILIVLRDSLHGDQRLWRRKPWIYLDANTYPTIPRVEDTATPLMSLAQAMGKFSQALGSWVLLLHVEYSLLHVFYLVSSVCVSILETCAKGQRAVFAMIAARLRFSMAIGRWLLGHRLPITRHGSEVEVLCALLVHDNQGITIDPDSLDPITHAEYAPCFDLAVLHSRLTQWFDKLKKESASALFLGEANSFTQAELYATARVRSRFQSCCWEKSSRSDLNSEPLAELHTVVNNVRILAWLCRGPTGEQDLRYMKQRPHLLWNWMLELKRVAKSPQGSYLRSRLQSHLIDRFDLLVERGCRVDHMMLDEGVPRSVWQLFLENTVATSHSHRNSPSGTARICTILIGAGSRSTDASYKYYLTGRDLADQSDDSFGTNDATFKTTILHESTLAHCYAAVEALTLQGFEVNALDSDGKSAHRLACTWKREHGYETASNDRSYENSRIIALLEQNGSIWDAVDYSTELPLGWKAITTRGGHGDDTVYCEKHFDGITFKKPTFSLFQDHRLALGFRTMYSRGQTYYLDLLRFLQPDAQEILPAGRDTRIFTAEWYRADIKTHKQVVRLPPYRSVGEANSGDIRTPLLRHSESLTDARIWMRRPTRVLQLAWHTASSSYLNLLLPLVPLSIVAAACDWTPSILIPIAVCALIPLSCLVRFAVKEALGGTISASCNLGSLVEDFDCLIELLICLSALKRGVTGFPAMSFPAALIMGAVLSSSLLRLGFCFIANGFSRLESLFNATVVMNKNELWIVAMVAWAVASVPELLVIQLHDTSSETPAKERATSVVLFSAAAVCIFYFVADLYFQQISHWWFLEDDGGEYHQEYDSVGEGHRHILNPKAAGILFLTLVPLLALCSDSLVAGLKATSPTTQILLALFVIPVTSHAEGFREAVVLSYRNNTQCAIIPVVSSVTCLLLFVQSVLVVAGRVLGSETVVTFGSVQAILLLVVAWIFSTTFAEGKSNYLDGIALIALYTILSLALSLYVLSKT